MTPWIDVRNGLPPIGLPCLLYITYPPDTMFNCLAYPLQRQFQMIGGLQYGGQWISYEDQYGEPLKHVSHWTSLPKPPGEK